MGQGILLSGRSDVDFMVHGYSHIDCLDRRSWITTTHVCVLIVF